MSTAKPVCELKNSKNVADLGQKRVSNYLEAKGCLWPYFEFVIDQWLATDVHIRKLWTWFNYVTLRNEEIEVLGRRYKIKEKKRCAKNLKRGKHNRIRLVKSSKWSKNKMAVYKESASVLFWSLAIMTYRERSFRRSHVGHISIFSFTRERRR